MSTKKAAKPAAKSAAEPAAKTGDATGAGVEELVKALGSRETVDAMIIATGMVSLREHIAAAVSKAVIKEVSETFDALHRIVEANKNNAEIIVKFLKQVMNDAADDAAKTISAAKIDLVACRSGCSGIEPVSIFSTADGGKDGGDKDGDDKDGGDKPAK